MCIAVMTFPERNIRRSMNVARTADAHHDATIRLRVGFRRDFRLS